MPKYLDVYEEPTLSADTQAQGCFLCGAKEGDGHWSMCPFSEGGSADTDPDADLSEQSAEIL